MPVTMIVTSVLGALFLLWYILRCSKQRDVKGLGVKMIVSVLYMCTAAFAIIERPETYVYGLLVIIGGIFGLLGDIYLDQKWIHLESKDDYLVLGFLVFGIGHIFYIVAAAMNAELELKDFIIPVIAAIAVPTGNDIMSKFLKQDFGKFRAIVFGYGAILAFMMGTAITAYVKTRSVAYLIYSVAGVSFLGSDVILSGMYFTKDGSKVTPFNFTTNIIAYYLAQYLIAITTYFIEV